MPSVMSQDELAEASSTIGVKEVGPLAWCRCRLWPGVMLLVVVVVVVVWVWV